MTARATFTIEQYEKMITAGVFEPAYSDFLIPQSLGGHLVHNRIEVHREPHGRDYRDTLTAEGDQEIRPLAIADASFRPSVLFAA